MLLLLLLLRGCYDWEDGSGIEKDSDGETKARVENGEGKISCGKLGIDERDRETYKPGRGWRIRTSAINGKAPCVNESVVTQPQARHQSNIANSRDRHNNTLPM